VPHAHLNRPDAAATSVQYAVSLNPPWPEAWHALAFTLVQSNQYQQAGTAAQKAIAEASDRLERNHKGIRREPGASDYFPVAR